MSTTPKAQIAKEDNEQEVPVIREPITVGGGGHEYTAGEGLLLSDYEFSADTTFLATQEDLSSKQDTLTAGENISIEDGTISATDTTYTAGTGLSLADTEFSVDTTTIQEKLTAGANIAIDGNEISATDTTYTAGANVQISANNEISATDTTYSDFTGTDGTSAGVAGLVPAPATTDAGKYLKADGTWDTVSAGPTVVQTTGTSQTDVMSQDASTKLVFPNSNRNSIGIGKISSQTTNTVVLSPSENATANGSCAVAIGRGATVNGNFSIGMGDRVNASGHYSVALGSYSTATRASTVSVGDGSNNANYGTRYIANVRDPSLAQDAATKNYVDSFYPVGTVYSSTSSTAPTFAGGTWTQIGTQTIGSATVYYYERTA